MPLVYIPPLLKSLTNGQEIVEVSGTNVREVIQAVEAIYPGFAARICDGDGLRSGLRSGLAVTVGTKLATNGLREVVDADSEVHFLPAISGG